MAEDESSNKVLEEFKPNIKTRQEDFRPRHLSSFYVSINLSILNSVIK